MAQAEIPRQIPEHFKPLLTETKAVAALATLMADGSPQVTPVWFDTTADAIRINTARGRVKDRNLSARSRVALAIVDPGNPFHYLQIRGHVVHATEQGAREHIEALSQKYRGGPYPWRNPNEIRVTYEIAVDSCQGQG